MIQILVVKGCADSEMMSANAVEIQPMISWTRMQAHLTSCSRADMDQAARQSVFALHQLPDFP
jgi:hypothetical protein